MKKKTESRNRESLKRVQVQAFYRDLVAAIVVNKFKCKLMPFYLSDNFRWRSFLSTSTSFICFLLIK